MKTIAAIVDQTQRKVAVWETVLLLHGAQLLNAGARQWIARRRGWRWVAWGMFHASETLGRGARQVYEAEIWRRRPR